MGNLKHMDCLMDNYSVSVPIQGDSHPFPTSNAINGEATQALLSIVQVAHALLPT